MFALVPYTQWHESHTMRTSFPHAVRRVHTRRCFQQNGKWSRGWEYVAGALDETRGPRAQEVPVSDVYRSKPCADSGIAISRRTDGSSAGASSLETSPAPAPPPAATRTITRSVVNPTLMPIRDSEIPYSVNHPSTVPSRRRREAARGPKAVRGTLQPAQPARGSKTRFRHSPTRPDLPLGVALRFTVARAAGARPKAARKWGGGARQRQRDSADPGGSAMI